MGSTGGLNGSVTPASYNELVLRALIVVAILAPAPARADGDLCARGVAHHGARIDLDVKDADVHDVLRLLADAGRVNLVISDDVAGKVTVKLARVAWDLAACTIAQVHHLRVTVHDNILLVRRGS
jgi:type II secretory pathway component HofQ